jgi:hypothetical protein
MYFFAIFMFIVFMVLFLAYARQVFLRPDRENKNKK